MNVSGQHFEESGYTPRSLMEVLRWRASNQADRRAFTFLLDGETEKASLTYQELDQEARSIAGLLQSLKAKGERALLLYPPGLEYISAFFGCIYAQVIAVPAYPPLLNRNLARIEPIAASSQARFALTTTTIMSNMKRLSSGSAILEKVHWLATTDLTLETAASWCPPIVDETSIAFLQYTSGSTGSPRGVIVSHGNLLHNLAAVCERFNLNHECLGVAWQPLFHDMGLIGRVLNPLYVGFPMMLMSPVAFLQYPIRWLRAISHYQATFSGAPSFGYDFCLRNILPADCASLDLTSWRLAAVGAEPIRPQALKRFADAYSPFGFRQEAFHPCYGLAEATLIVTGNADSATIKNKILKKSGLEQNRVIAAADNEADAQEIAGCGPPLNGEEVIIAHPETSNICSPDEVGEIWVRGPSVSPGYWNDPGATQKVFNGRIAFGDENTFLRTGDLGFMSDNELYVTGRLKDLIIIRGLNHYPQDIELTVAQSHRGIHPSRLAAFCLDVSGEERLVVVAEIEPLFRSLTAEIFPAIRSAIVEQHEISAYAIVLVEPGTIPMTSSGKIRRRECRARYRSNTLNIVECWCDPNDNHVFGESIHQQPIRVQQSNRNAEDMEAWLISSLAERLHLAPAELNVLQPFSSYGLDSVAAVALRTELEDLVGRQLPPTLAWNYPNIRCLAQYLTGRAISHGSDEGSAVGLSEFSSAAPLAIIGMACRFPGASDVATFWQLLRDGRDAITEVPAERWDVNQYFDTDPTTPGKTISRWGGFLDQVDQFDAHFFGISPREADRMDPQQRVLLEVSWEAIESAGLPAAKLAGTSAGVFVGISTNDYAQLVLEDRLGADVYDGTGNSLSITANRISYFLDLRGPSVAVDTACSSSLVAFHMACQGLRNGECSLALIGAVNLMLSPETTIRLSQARMLSPVGRCSPFDASADGYVRGEGCGVVIVKRLRDALNDGDRILAIVRGTAVNQDGRSNGLTAPNGPAQQEVMRKALANAGLEPAQISYVEAHGSGTPLGDPIEFQALQTVFGEGREVESPCFVGSVKTNIGHLEAAAGMAGLIKVVLALNHEEIPAHLHLQKVNPHISVKNSLLEFPTQRSSWSRGVAPRYAGVSSFGFGGTNAHVILEESPRRAIANVEREGRPLHVLTLSAYSERALKDLCSKYKTYSLEHAEVSVADICHTANSGRSHFRYRLACPVATTAQLAEKLEAFTNGRVPDDVVWTKQISRERLKMVFLFSGEGSQYVGMGKELYRTQSVFRHALDHCAEVLAPLLSKPLQSVLFSSHDNNLLNNTAYAQPALFSVEYALAELWRSWGIEPDAVMGYSIGEYAAACIAGVFPVEECLRLVAERGKLMATLHNKGSMAVVFSDAEQVARLPAVASGQLAIAAVNGPHNTVIAGKTDLVQAVLRELAEADLPGQMLTGVSQAFHSSLMDPVLTAIEAAATNVSFAAPQIPLISNLSGVNVKMEMGQADYWRRHARETVQFLAGMTNLCNQGHNVFIEIGPNDTLLQLGQQCLPQERMAWLPSLQTTRRDWQVLIESLATLYVRGASIDWDRFDRSYTRHKVELPAYPFERHRHWIDSVLTSPVSPERLPAPNLADRQPHPLLGRKVN